MAGVQVKKVVAVCFLEATRQALDHIAAHRMQNQDRAGPQGNDLARMYGEVRRLRDYLQRCASAPQETVDLDLAAADQGLLVACCRRAVDAIEVRLAGEQAVPAEEKQWLQKKRQVLADWAVELAQKPLVELPLPRVGQSTTEAGRALLARLQKKLFGDVNDRPKIMAPTSGINSMAAGISVVPEKAEGTPAEPPAASAAVLARRSASFGLPDAVEVPPLVIGQQIKDHRLRALVVNDLCGLTRAREARDHRIATVLLASVLEAALVDHALAHRPELALAGSPDTWDPQTLLVRIMGDAFTPKDRSLAYHLFSSRNLLRPALQLVAPIVVTESSFVQAYDFVLRALHAMGFATGAAPEVAAAGTAENASPQGRA